MPFTPSHAAAALLFTRTPLFPAAIVAGSVAPDLPYYVPLAAVRDLTHEPVSIITVDLAIGVLAFLLWQFVLRAPVIDFAPLWLRSRMPQRPGRAFAPESWSPIVTALVVIASVVVGAATHLLWDAFTHPGWIVDRLTVLRLQAGPLLVHKWLQHVSTIGGLAAIAVWTVVWVRRTPATVSTEAGGGARPVIGENDPRRLRRWVLAGIATVFVVSGLAAWIVAIASGQAPFDPAVVFTTARICVGAALAALATVCLAWHVSRRLAR